MTKHQRKINIFYKQNSDNHHHHHHLLLAHRSAISTLCVCVWEREKNWMNNGLQSSRPNHEVGHRRRGWNCCSGSRWENLWEANGDREELRSRHAGYVAEYLRACPQPWPSFLFSPDDVLRLLQWLRRWPACLDTRPVISLLSLSLLLLYQVWIYFFQFRCSWLYDNHWYAEMFIWYVLMIFKQISRLNCVFWLRE